MTELLTDDDVRRLARIVEDARSRIPLGVAMLRGSDSLLLDEEGRRARERLVLANSRLVYFFATSYARRLRLPVEDLAQEGFVALLRAIDDYDWRRGRLSTFAGTIVRRAIAQRARSRCGELHLSERQLVQLDERDEFPRAALPPASLEVFAAQGWDPPCGASQEHLSAAENDLTWLLQQLDPLSRRIVELRFGFGCEPHTFEQVMRKTDMSMRQVRTRLDNALKYMRATHLRQAA